MALSQYFYGTLLEAVGSVLYIFVGLDNNKIESNDKEKFIKAMEDAGYYYHGNFYISSESWRIGAPRFDSSRVVGPLLGGSVGGRILLKYRLNYED